MRHPVEVDWLGALERLANGPAPRVVIAPAAIHAALDRALVDEAKAFHAVEADVTRRRIAALDDDARRRADDVGHAGAVDAAARARASLADHEGALAAIDEARADAALAAWQVVPAANAGDIASAAATLVDLHDDGWTRATTDEARRAARRAFLGLPSDRDWN